MHRYSEAYKKEIVRRIDANEKTISAIVRDEKLAYASVYRWLETFSVKHQKSVVMVTELTSESERSKRLEAENAKLLTLIGKQQVEIAYWQSLIDVAEERYQIDIKKNCVTKP